MVNNVDKILNKANLDDRASEDKGARSIDHRPTLSTIDAGVNSGVSNSSDTSMSRSRRVEPSSIKENIRNDNMDFEKIRKLWSPFVLPNTKQTMKQLIRTHGVCINCLHEVCTG